MEREIRRLARDIAAHAEWQAMSGVRAVPQGLTLPRAAEDPVAVALAVEAPRAEAALAAGAAASSDAGDGPSRAAVAAGSHAAPVAAAATLDDLRAAIGDCRL